ncbi:hypothetical protein FOMPIDRAFT_1164900 [Fomitopsis schrenkii]|uniref:RWD domain-containing protein n=1 Tax=Fomitopsis schrenkii TaxID=2126942 RepID=S8FAY5_FOMSC|nr:hypothetical protein FOMPIDRAFT_1164900 [Fomitopsis schrenkii]
MSRTPSPHFPTLDALIEHLSADSEREELAAELGALQSIYGDHAILPWDRNIFSADDNAREARVRSGERGTIRYEVTIRAHSVSPPSEPDTTHPLTLLVSLPPSYPAAIPPQLQLLSRYVGPYGVDPALFGAVLRTYISRDGVEWAPGGVCVFDGVEWVREACGDWLGERMSEQRAGEILREDERAVDGRNEPAEGEDVRLVEGRKSARGVVESEAEAKMPEGVEFTIPEPIVDRKSVFIGRACPIMHPSQVPLILAHLMSDRKIARAAHPIINAWRCRVGQNLHQDNDDDGETAAGGRLAHLLQILDVENVLVVVTRYYGGIHLGPDRFKHINQAARNALELGGFLDAPTTESHSGRKKGRGAHK